MKKIFLSLTIVFISLASFSQNVAINSDGSNADASAMLDVKSTTKGLLIPRMTTAQRSAIVAPATGLIVFDTDTKTFWFYSGSLWTNLLATGGGSLKLPFDTTVNFSAPAFSITNNNSTAINGVSANSAGVYGGSNAHTGVIGFSTNGYGMYANSTNNSALYAFATNALPTIKSSNTTGVAINAISSGNHGILATSSAVSKAGVRGESTVAGGDGIFGLNTGGGVGVRAESNTGTGLSAYSNTGTAASVYSNSGTALYASSPAGTALYVSGKVKISGGNTNPVNGGILTSDASGNAVWKASKVAFHAFNDDGIVSTGSLAYNQTSVITFAGEDYDYTNSYTNGLFTVPVSGLYHFGGTVTLGLYDLNDNIDNASVSIKINRGGIIITKSHSFQTSNKNSTSSWWNFMFDFDVKLVAGDVVSLQGWQLNGAKTSVGCYGNFYGHLVFAE